MPESQCRVTEETYINDVIDRMQKEKTVAALAVSCLMTINNFATRPQSKIFSFAELQCMITGDAITLG